MSKHEKTFGNVMLGVLLGIFVWAASGSLFAFMFRDDLFFFAHHGRTGGYADVDAPY